MASFTIRAFDSKTASFVKKAFCDFLKATPNLCEIRIDDLPPFLHTLADEFRKLTVPDTMMSCHLLRILKIHDRCCRAIIFRLFVIVYIQANYQLSQLIESGDYLHYNRLVIVGIQYMTAW